MQAIDLAVLPFTTSHTIKFVIPYLFLSLLVSGGRHSALTPFQENKEQLSLL